MNNAVVERIGERGDGLAHGKIIPRSLPGEIYGPDGSLLKPSADRIPPICPVFESCGGCKLQHWAHAPYAAWKRNLIVSALTARGISADIAPMQDAHGAGRRRVVLHVREVDGRWRAGFMGEGTHKLVALEQCPVLVPALQAAPLVAAKFGPFFGACDVAVSAADNGLDVAIKAQRKLADRAVAQLEPVMRPNRIVRIAVNGEALAQIEPPFLQIGRAQVSLPPGAFLQATSRGEELLAHDVVRLAKKAKRVADLFCGLGPFALRLAETAAVEAYDSDKPAVAALQGAVRNTQGLKPLQAQARDLFANPLTPMELNVHDFVVLDPPRAGAEAQCRMLAKSKVKALAYVSCDPQTFARDTAILAAAGYGLRAVTPVDQFKYAAHVELVGHFKRA